MFFLEAKTAASLSDASVCQTVRYYMSTERISTLRGKVFPSLACVITESEASIISFPYVAGGQGCVDAAVSAPISFHPDPSVKGVSSIHCRMHPCLPGVAEVLSGTYLRVGSEEHTSLQAVLPPYHKLIWR